MAIQEDRSRALALAGGAIVNGLLETLVDKNILTVPEIRGVILKAMNSLTPYKATPAGYEAHGMLAAILHDRFPQDRAASPDPSAGVPRVSEKVVK